MVLAKIVEFFAACKLGAWVVVGWPSKYGKTTLQNLTRLISLMDPKETEKPPKLSSLKWNNPTLLCPTYSAKAALFCIAIKDLGMP